MKHVVVVDDEGTPSLSLDGLEDLERALKAKPFRINQGLRLELLRLIDYLIFDAIMNERDARARRPPAIGTRVAAMIAIALYKKEATSIKDAVLAVISDRKYFDRVYEATKKLRHGKFKFEIDEGTVKRAAARLSGKGRK